MTMRVVCKTSASSFEYQTIAVPRPEHYIRSAMSREGHHLPKDAWIIPPDNNEVDDVNDLLARYYVYDTL